MNRASAAWVSAALLAGWACDSGEAAGPAGPPIQPGLYLLSDIGSVPAPYTYERLVHQDGSVRTLSFVFDSVRILNDSAFERHFRRELVLNSPAFPPIVESAEEFRFTGLILDRDDEIKLTVRSGLLPGGHDLAYFTPVEHGTALARQLTTRQYSCSGNLCELVREQRVMASYARQ